MPANEPEANRPLLSELFARSVAAYPQALALDIPPGRDRARVTFTYRALAERVQAVATRLASHDLAGEPVVAILLPRSSPWLLACQLGALHAGAAHVCLDPSYPPAHVAHVLRDTNAIAVLTDARGAQALPSGAPPDSTAPDSAPANSAPANRAPANRATPVIVVESLACTAQPFATPAPRAPDWLAYLIYTSGTTGQPKGVQVPHRGVVNLIESGVRRFALGPGERIAQGSSAAYDSSIEETWLALASGATVVVVDDETIRTGPDLVAWLRQERITVFCPPPTLLRAMDCADPRRELPELRLCYVGGEALPQDLADLWGAALWLENGYGPTECSVTVVRGRVSPGQGVTIGTPVPNNQAWLLDEQLRPVADGEIGELCISGVALARGYLGAPELTAQRFPTLPGIGRVYRTGDLARRRADGAIECLGRADAQVKLRGHRLELEAVEAVLARCEGVREVACCVQGDGEARLLAAHVVPADAAAPPSFAALAEAARAALPEHAVPARFGLLANLPRSLSGKLDRKRLPVLQADHDGHHANGALLGALPSAPRTRHEQRVRAAFAAVLGAAADALGRDDDFFARGGDSLKAAVLVSRLRRDGDSVAVRDVYAAPSIAALAAQLEARSRTSPAAPSGSRRHGSGAEGPARPAKDHAATNPWHATLAQTAWLLLALVLVAWAGYVAAFVVLPWLLSEVSLTAALLLAPWLGSLALVLYTAVTLGATWLTKRVLIGHYQPGRAPVWGDFYVRHWLVSHLAQAVPWRLLAGCELHCAALRLLGARIGQRVHIHHDVDLHEGGWDLLTLGDDVTLCREVDLGMVQLDAGALVMAPVRLDAGVTLATRAGTGGDVQIGAGTLVRPLAFVPDGARIAPDVTLAGVPAQACGAAPAVAAIDVPSQSLSPWHYAALLLGARLLAAPAAALPFAVAFALLAEWVGVDAERLAEWLCAVGPGSNLGWALATIALAVVALPVTLLSQALALRWLPRVPAGTHARWSRLHLLLTVRTELVSAAGIWLSGTLFWPAWLRLCGMHVGRDCEVSTILDVLPEHVALAGGSFLADGIYLGVPHQHRGAVTVRATALGAGSFLGNHVVIDAGQQLPNGLVLGVNTIADQSSMRPDTGWFGQPPFALPRREVVTVDRRLTHEPDALRYVNRLFWEALRTLLPAGSLALTLWWFDVLAARPWSTAAWLAPLATLTVAFSQALCVLATKWLLLGRVRPGQHGLWSCWASRWDFHYVMWQQYGRILLQPLEGTVWLVWYLRAMGMHIGKRVVLGSGFAQVVDPDMLILEDDATVHAMFQAHSFEDRVLKIDHVRLGRGSTVGRGAVVLYGAEIGDGARVMPHSVVMKREVLLAGREYAGVPTAEVEREAVDVTPRREPAAAR